jgi:hypothetical protein
MLLAFEKRRKKSFGHVLFWGLLFVSIAGSASPPADDQSGDCAACKRTIVVQAISLTDPSFTTDIVTAWLAPLLSSGCVAVKPFGAEPKPEYILVARFETDPAGKFPDLDGTYSEFSTIRGAGSIMTIILFSARGRTEPRDTFGAFGRGVPDYGCFVLSGKTEEESRSWEVHKEPMKGQLRTGVPLERFLQDWENAPVSVRIQPEKEDIEAGEKITIRVTDFRGQSGKRMKTDCQPNRVLFKAEKGEILNNEVPIGTIEDPKLMPYPVDIIAWGDEYVLKYKAPDKACTKDTIFVYNSCDILNQGALPLEQTRKKDLIGQKVLKIKCDQWSGAVNYSRNITWSDRQPITDGYILVNQMLSESATVNLTLRHTHVYASSAGTEQYYDEPVKAQGTYSLTLKKITRIVDEKRGSWTKIEETVVGGGDLEEVSAATLVVNSDNGEYDLHLVFRSPECIGTSVTTSDKGLLLESEYSYILNSAGVDFKGKVGKGSITGSWSLPAGKNTAVALGAGQVPGASFNWNFSR